jgi:hypothetical protein
MSAWVPSGVWMLVCHKKNAGVGGAKGDRRCGMAEEIPLRSREKKTGPVVVPEYREINSCDCNGGINTVYPAKKPMPGVTPRLLRCLYAPGGA